MTNTQRPRLGSGIRYYPLGADGVLIESESEGALPLKGFLWSRLLPLLDGSKTVGELARSFANPADQFELYRALFVLRERCLLENGPVPDDAVQSFWKASAARGARVRVEQKGNVDATSLETMLHVAGIAIDASASVAVVLTDDYRKQSLADVNRRHLLSGHPWLLMKCDGRRSWIGPVFTPGRGPCWDCLASRLRVNQSELEFMESLGIAVSADTPESHGTAATRMLAAIAIPILERICMVGNGGALTSIIWTLDLDTLAHESHHVVRRKQCAACGDPTLAGGSAEFQLQTRSRLAGDAAGRASSPWLTYERFRHHISPISGAVPELQPGLLEQNPFHLFSAGPNRATPIRSTEELLAFSLRSKSGGKGISPEQAITGALAEALERYSCSWRGDGRSIRARVAELGREAIDPRTILNFSAAQYLDRASINARSERYNRVPEAFDPEQVIEWTPVRSLTSERRYFVPTALCWFGYAAPFAYADSNGCAAGNNLEEAILQGLCELIERDSAAIWWYNQIARPAIDLESLADPWCSSMVKLFRDRYGRVTKAIDLTGDLGVPVTVVVSYREDAERPEFFFGLGAHLDPVAAVRRAFTEMCQFFGSVTAWAGDQASGFAGLSRNMDPGMAAWLSNASTRDQPQMIPTSPTRQVQDIGEGLRPGADIMGDIENLLARFKSAGLEAFALDCTQPDIEMPVARVFVPGLRHFWARLAPGRLYDVPVKLGWLEKERSENDLNPVAMFF